VTANVRRCNKKLNKKMSQNGRHTAGFVQSVLRLALLCLIVNCQLSIVHCYAAIGSAITKIDSANFNAHVIRALENADGTPIKELESIFKLPEGGNRMIKIFGDNVDNAASLLKELEADAIFSQIFKVIE
jgi:hypothetical protein